MICPLCVILMLTLCGHHAKAMTGRDVYAHMRNVLVQGLDRKIDASMLLIDSSGQERRRSLTEYSKKTGPESCKIMVIFSTPPDLKGVGFLIHAATFSERTLWAYFPEYKRVRRIPDTAQDDSFFGSDFSYDDFCGPPDLDDFSYVILDEASVDGHPCVKVKVTPTTPRKYTHFVGWVDTTHWVHRQIEYYQDKELFKTAHVRGIEIIEGIPTPRSLEMRNHRSNHRTQLSIERIEYGTQFPEEMFSQRYLERGLP